MWPIDRKKGKKEKKEIRKKGIIIPAGGEFKLPLPPVRFDNGKCFILVNGKEQLIGEEGLIALIQVDCARPLKIKVFPDCKNRRLDAVEIIDVDDKKEYPKDGPQFKFVGLGAPTREDIIQHLKNIEQMIEKHIEELDKEIAEYNKRARRSAYRAVIALSIILPIQFYLIYIDTGIWRIVNIVSGIINIIGIFACIYIIKKTNERDIMIKNKNKDMIESLAMENVEIVKEK